MTGVSHYVDSLLTALYATETEHEIITVASLLPAHLLENPERSGTFGWLDSARARLEVICQDPRLSHHPMFANRERMRAVVSTCERMTIAPFRRVVTAFRVPRFCAQVDLLHVPNITAFRFGNYGARRNVATIYDMSTRIYRQAHSMKNILAWEHLFKFAKMKCARILTISESTKQDVVRLLGISDDRIDVTPLAPRASTRKIQDQDVLDRFLTPLNLTGSPFVLYAGTLEPRKNLDKLVRGFAQAIAETHSIPHKLVLAGGHWNQHDLEMKRLAQRLGIGDRLVLTGYVPNEQMNALMSACDVFAYVSLYEGFGLPPLEAMVCGAPVVASNTSSLPEVIGEAGLSVDPTRVEPIAEALHRLITDRNENARLRALSAQQATRFSWERTAALTLQSYEAAAA